MSTRPPPRSSLSAFATRPLVAVAEIEAGPLFDFTQTRPQVRVRDGVRETTFPENTIHLARGGESGRDALVIAGQEPHLQWPSFSEQLADYARACGVETAVVLRSFPASVPHTRPVLLRLTTRNSELAESLALAPLEPTYEGPIDVGEVVLNRLAQEGCATAGLTVLVPNYLGIVPNPMAVLSVTELLDRYLGVRTSMAEYREAAEKVRQQADHQVEQSGEVREAVRGMEEQYESIARQTSGGAPEGSGDSDGGELPSVEELLSDVERFLAGDGDDKGASPA